MKLPVQQMRDPQSVPLQTPVIDNKHPNSKKSSTPTGARRKPLSSAFKRDLSVIQVA